MADKGSPTPKPKSGPVVEPSRATSPIYFFFYFCAIVFYTYIPYVSISLSNGFCTFQRSNILEYGAGSTKTAKRVGKGWFFGRYQVYFFTW
jgi:hypothetical protein